MTGEDVLVNADLAMYDAKEAGRDQLAAYDGPERPETRIEARISWADMIRDALAEDRFVLHAQPIVDLATGEATQYELLLRMRGADGELIPPVRVPPRRRALRPDGRDRPLGRGARDPHGRRRAARRAAGWSSRSTSPAAPPATPSCSS